MDCLNGHENEEVARFCTTCGESFAGSGGAEFVSEENIAAASPDVSVDRTSTTVPKQSPGRKKILIFCGIGIGLAAFLLAIVGGAVLTKSKPSQKPQVASGPSLQEYQGFANSALSFNVAAPPGTPSYVPKGSSVTVEISKTDPRWALVSWPASGSYAPQGAAYYMWMDYSSGQYYGMNTPGTYGEVQPQPYMPANAGPPCPDQMDFNICTGNWWSRSVRAN
jgi:hypothetical protein